MLLAMPLFLIKCPSCGRRFRVKHTGERLENREIKSETITKSELTPGALSGEEPGEKIQSIEILPLPGAGSVLEEKEEAEVEEDTYTESYVCRHCGHKWTQKVTRHRRLGGSASED